MILLVRTLLLSSFSLLTRTTTTTTRTRTTRTTKTINKSLSPSSLSSLSWFSSSTSFLLSLSLPSQQRQGGGSSSPVLSTAGVAFFSRAPVVVSAEEDTTTIWRTSRRRRRNTSTTTKRREQNSSPLSSSTTSCLASGASESCSTIMEDDGTIGSTKTTATTTHQKPATSGMNKNTASSLGYLDAESAAALDEELMSQPGFCLEQLMELAGLSVAEAVHQIIEEKKMMKRKNKKTTGDDDDDDNDNILIICGPGNNGGDGLVAARHLVMFGHDKCTVLYPKRSTKQPHYTNLVQQCIDVGINVLYEWPAAPAAVASSGEQQQQDNNNDHHHHYSVIIDAIFGFSFKGIPREPFASIIKRLKTIQQRRTLDNDVDDDVDSTTIISVDVPSGWDVNTGNVVVGGGGGGTNDNDDDDDNSSSNMMHFIPDVLISLTAPKLSSTKFKGRHFVGGRFLPPKLAKKYMVSMPHYPGVSQVVEINND